MEPITLCGAVIVMFGLWVEFEPTLLAIVKVICKCKLFKEMNLQSTVPKPVYVRRMPICLAKGFH
ncbi:MAG: hypothetical protein GJV46_13760 [Geobacter sp.]|nr:hypothetical protein [Geobacter sp.]